MGKTKNNIRSNRKYKDSLFRHLFGNEKHKDWTLQLFNALNNTNYKNPDEIVFTTIENVFFITVNNDVSFLHRDIVSMWEHQSTYCANMTLRFYQYYARQIDLLVDQMKISIFGKDKIMFKPPQFFVFYNGEKEMPDEMSLNLNEHFKGDGKKIELSAKMLNINLNHNQELMDKCRPLYEYAWLIAEVRENLKISNRSKSESILLAIESVPDHYVIKNMLMSEKAKVTKMIMTESEYEKELEKIAWGREQEGIRKGKKLGIQLGKIMGKREATERGIINMIAHGYPDDEILSVFETINKEEIKRFREKHPHKTA